MHGSELVCEAASVRAGILGENFQYDQCAHVAVKPHEEIRCGMYGHIVNQPDVVGFWFGPYAALEYRLVFFWYSDVFYRTNDFWWAFLDLHW